MKSKIKDAKEIVEKLEEVVGDLDHRLTDSKLVDLACERLNMPILNDNPLFARTVACCRKKGEK